MTLNPYQIRVEEIWENQEDREYVLEAPLDLADPRGDYTCSDPLRARVTVSLAGKDTLRALVNYQTRVSGKCDRCLEPVIQAVSGQAPLLFQRNQASGSQDEWDWEADELLPTDGKTLDLEDQIRQLVLLDIAYPFLCRETCRGLCPQCGADLNRESCACPGTGSARPGGARLGDVWNSLERKSNKKKNN